MPKLEVGAHLFLGIICIFYVCFVQCYIKEIIMKYKVHIMRSSNVKTPTEFVKLRELLSMRVTSLRLTKCNVVIIYD